MSKKFLQTSSFLTLISLSLSSVAVKAMEQDERVETETHVTVSRWNVAQFLANGVQNVETLFNDILYPGYSIAVAESINSTEDDEAHRALIQQDIQEPQRQLPFNEVREYVLSVAVQSLSSLIIDKDNGTLSIAGWAVDTEKEGPAEFVAVSYKNGFPVTTPVNHYWGGVTAHFNAKEIPGNFDQSGFIHTFSFPQGASDFDPNDIQVMAYSEGKKYPTSIYKKCMNSAVSLEDSGEVFHNGVRLLQDENIVGWAEMIGLNVGKKILEIHGWSAIRGVGPANYVSAFYKKNLLGSVLVYRDSPNVVSDPQFQGILGNYSTCGYVASHGLDVSNLNFQDFNPQDLTIVGFDHQNRYNILQKNMSNFKFYEH
ncbi:MAG: hypothetical protein BGO67_00560 [Alphaproteobacteria bacterium 41-28]|jgi:hypothetical protein|nr:MAG: hypothetical protein BGO67_00560 [Alphaproteobacteria bacterium 41-28]